MSVVVVSNPPCIVCLKLTPTFRRPSTMHRAPDPFAKQALAYSLARPTYPAALVRRITERCTRPVHESTCVDVACGSGQMTHLLGGVGFKHVWGFDVSEAQLKHAKSQSNNVTFMVGDAHSLPQVATASIDVVTVAQALHWFDFDRFMREARRILRPGGLLAIAGYKWPCLEDEPKAQEAWENYYLNVLKSHAGPSETLWDIDRRRVDSGYEGEPFDRYFARCETQWFPDTRLVTCGDFVTFMESQSAFQKIKPRFSTSPIAPIKDALGTNTERRIKCTFPFFLVLGLNDNKSVL